jgi:carbonic anhydrase
MAPAHVASARGGFDDALADKIIGVIGDQHPFAIIVACADSRTAPEIVFDQNTGDLFVVRTAGNLVDRVKRLNARFFGTTLVQ